MKRRAIWTDELLDDQADLDLQNLSALPTVNFYVRPLIEKHSTWHPIEVNQELDKAADKFSDFGILVQWVRIDNPSPNPNNPLFHYYPQIPDTFDDTDVNLNTVVSDSKADDIIDEKYDRVPSVIFVRRLQGEDTLGVTDAIPGKGCAVDKHPQITAPNGVHLTIVHELGHVLGLHHPPKDFLQNNIMHERQTMHHDALSPQKRIMRMRIRQMGWDTKP